MNSQSNASELLARHWDVVVIGTGIGGGSAARRLAEKGLSVLMLEKGFDLGAGSESDLTSEASDPQQRLRAGKWPLQIEGSVDGRHIRTEGMIGARVGGTSINYAATLERPEPHDLNDQPDRPHPTGGWPIGYSGMQPYFDLAEQNFRISGEQDPLSSVPAPMLRPARPMARVDADLTKAFRQSGLHPYQTHLAAEFGPDCEQCFGRACPRLCKMDGRSAGVLPALATGHAALLDGCSVTRIEADTTISRLHGQRDGQAFAVTARSYVLAAGGAGSPLVMLRSANEAWPDGLGNRHDQVGRNLMFHLSELVALWPQPGQRSAGPSRAISLRDLYFHGGQRFGLVQSMGIDTDYGLILLSLHQQFDSSRFRKARFLRPMLRPLPWAALRLLGPAKIFVGVLEDLPYAENRITADPTDPDRIVFNYVIHDELRERRHAFREAIRAAFGGHRKLFLSPAPNLNLAHPCGTLRFGNDPRTSVLDPDCRVHGIDNLYVADSSFMPTSNGCNPSLTIAANAYRVADRLAERLTGSG